MNYLEEPDFTFMEKLVYRGIFALFVLSVIAVVCDDLGYTDALIN